MAAGGPLSHDAVISDSVLRRAANKASNAVELIRPARRSRRWIGSELGLWPRSRAGRRRSSVVADATR